MGSYHRDTERNHHNMEKRQSIVPPGHSWVQFEDSELFNSPRNSRPTEGFTIKMRKSSFSGSLSSSVSSGSADDDWRNAMNESEQSSRSLSTTSNLNSKYSVFQDLSTTRTKSTFNIFPTFPDTNSSSDKYSAFDSLRETERRGDTGGLGWSCQVLPQLGWSEEVRGGPRC